jgi:hypothetical protein
MGRKVILDNSLFELETPFDADEFGAWVKKLKPTEYIIPDALEDLNLTISNFYNFKEKFQGGLPGKSIGVVQGKTYEEIVECYKFMDKHADIVAISFDYSFYLNEWPTIEAITDELFIVPQKWLYAPFNKWVRYALGRQCLLSRLMRRGVINTEKDHHLLGCAIPGEFSAYKTLNWIKSVDTSNPVVAGIIGKKYTSEIGLDEKWSVKLVDLIHADLDKQQMEYIMYNTNMFRRFCNDK